MKNKDIRNQNDNKKNDDSFMYLMILMGLLVVGVILIILKYIFEF